MGEPGRQCFHLTVGFCKAWCWHCDLLCPRFVVVWSQTLRWSGATFFLHVLSSVSVIRPFFPVVLEEEGGSVSLSFRIESRKYGVTRKALSPTIFIFCMQFLLRHVSSIDRSVDPHMSAHFLCVAFVKAVSARHGWVLRGWRRRRRLM